MILFVGLILIVVAAYFIAKLIAYDSGYVMLAYGGHAVELSFWWALLILILSFICGYFCIRLLKALLNSTNIFSRWKNRRNRKSSQIGLAQGLFSYFSGDWKKANKELLASAKKSYTPELNFLAAAHTSFMQGDYENAHNLLKEAKAINKNTNNLAIDICFAQVFFEQSAYSSCAQLCEIILKKTPKQPMVNRLLVDSYVALKNWSSLESFLPALEKQKIVMPEELAEYRAQIVLNKIAHADTTGAEGLFDAWKNLTKIDKANPHIIKDYVERILVFSKVDEAEKILVQALNQQWSGSLVKLYGKVQSSDATKQLRQVNLWLNQREEDSDLLLTAGRIALMNQLWGKAKSYFEKSIAVKSQPETYAELGRLLLNLGELENGSRCFEQGLLEGANELPKLPMPK